MVKKFLLYFVYFECICWGCDKYCFIDVFGCGNGLGCMQYFVELLGDDWYEFGDWGIEVEVLQKVVIFM